MSSPSLVELAEQVCSWAGDDEQVEVYVGRGRETQIRVYEGAVEKLATADSAGVGIRVVRDHRQGFAYAGTLDEAILAETLADARDNAAFGDPDEALGLAIPDGVAVPPLDLFRPGLADFATEAKVDLALELERAVRGADARIVGLEACDYEDGSTETAVVTTTGIRVESAETYCYLSADALATVGDETQTGFWFSLGRQPDELDAAACAAEVAVRATRMLGATKPASARTTVVLDPFVTAQFLGLFGFALSGEQVLKGRSFLADRMGETVGAPVLTLVEDPTNALAMSATGTDGEGLATRRVPLLDAGVLAGFVHDSYTARRLGSASTGSAVRGFSSTPSVGTRALALTPGDRSPEQLLDDVGDGVLIASVAGLHSGVNPVSGDFSTGAEGIRIVGGALTEPLREFTIASTLQRMLADVQAVGNDIAWLPMGAAGVSLVVADVSLSGR
ncbi:MAG: TldD/PmbA family protein [Acidimicrobiales bacterium]